MGLFQKQKPVENRQIPQHIAVIMDGNGRWAKKRHLPRSAGHAAGSETFRKIAIYCQEIGVKYFTVYAFSTENWKRPQAEVEALMNLFRKYLRESMQTMRERGVAIRVVGDLSALPQDILDLIAETDAVANSIGEHVTTATLCINYGGRDEIKNAVQTLAKQVQEGKLLPEEITEERIGQSLYTSNMPDPDLIIRPSGEVRTSNFLLWQSAYAEYYFTSVLWPDFQTKDMDAAIDDFNHRQRRFGGV